MFIRAYLRASTKEQDASRARAELDSFAAERGERIASYYEENESGASLKRPELFKLLNEAGAGDVLLVEQVDRLSRLSTSDWTSLKNEIRTRGIRVVSVDLPTSWAMLNINHDEVAGRVMTAMNDMLLDVLAAVARKDYEDRRRRQAEGIRKAQAEGRMTGGQPDWEKRRSITTLLDEGVSWSKVQKTLGVSRATISKAAKEPVR